MCIVKIIIEYLIITAIYNKFIKLTRTFTFVNIDGNVTNVALKDFYSATSEGLICDL